MNSHKNPQQNTSKQSLTVHLNDEGVFIPAMQGFFNICKPVWYTTWTNWRIILIVAENVSDKAQHSFMIKTLQKVGKEGTYLNNKAIYVWQSYR